MTNTERLIAALEHAVRFGTPEISFVIGRYTGNGPAVVAALTRRGYVVERTSIVGTYILKPKPVLPTFVVYGRAFGIVAEFPNTDKGMTAANAYMEAYADTGLLATTPAHLILAKLADKGVPAYPKAPA